MHNPLQYTIKRNGDGYWVVMLGRHVMAKRVRKADCQAWVDLQNGIIDSIESKWRGTNSKPEKHLI